MPLNFIKENQLVASVFGPKRTAQIPKFKIWKLDAKVIGDQTVATPPPHRNSIILCKIMLIENAKQVIIPFKARTIPKEMFPIQWAK